MATADLRKGYLLGLTTFSIWGLFPLYFKSIEQFAALEIVTQRAIWSALFGTLILMLWRHPGWWQELLAHPRRIGVLMISSVLIASNRRTPAILPTTYSKRGTGFARIV